ncbi:MAG: oxidoreductase [Alphaproteobacteria bacterium]|nr:oxidoreductase [Alphaproteobacteria bacterium]
MTDLAAAKGIAVIVTAMRDDGGQVRIFDLAAANGAALPAFAPGDHVAVQCGAGIVRYYSLWGPVDDTRVYRIAVKRETESRGGSRWMHEHVAVGGHLMISPPRSNFPLAAGRSGYFFISGGIGLTPILAMLDALRRQGKRARLLHQCRSPADLAFAPELRRLGADHEIEIHVDSLAGGFRNLAADLDRLDVATEVYCCGPAPMMALVRAHGEGTGRIGRYHFESFAAEPQATAAENRPFVAVIASTGQEIEVAADETLLVALKRAGFEIESECEEGICATCATGVVAGTPDHRDSVLTDAQRAESKFMMVCVSRAKSDRIVLAL